MQDTTTKPLFSADLTPHRLMGARERWAVVGLASLLGAIPGLISLSAGAWPIAVFIAIAVAGMAIALKFSNAEGKRHERITLWSDRLDVDQFDIKGAVRRRQFNPRAVRLIIDRDFDEQTTRLRLRSGDGDLEIGEFLNNDDKSSFGKVFGTALKKARITPVKTGS
ncbi:DUF2244 domain-containing protein [Devosia sp.]|uniref:DUF2244 domain-containing protein n=1 Tax=Devosia sp. TaxID=1871048 RepID=UPI0032650DDB